MRDTANEQATKEGRDLLRWTPGALAALQEGTEAYMVDIFRDTANIAVHGKRQTIFPKDMQLAVKVGRYAPRCT